MPERTGSSPAIPWALAAIVIAGLVTFSATRDEEAPPPTTTTTTTFPRRAYIDEMAAALGTEVRVSLGEEGARCIATAMLDALGLERLEALAEQAAPLDALAPEERDQVLRFVVACVDPVVAEALLSTGTTVSEPLAPLPDEGG